LGEKLLGEKVCKEGRGERGTMSRESGGLCNQKFLTVLRKGKLLLQSRSEERGGRNRGGKGKRVQCFERRLKKRKKCHHDNPENVELNS